MKDEKVEGYVHSVDSHHCPVLGFRYFVTIEIYNPDNSIAYLFASKAKDVKILIKTKEENDFHTTANKRYGSRKS